MTYTRVFLPKQMEIYLRPRSRYELSYIEPKQTNKKVVHPSVHGHRNDLLKMVGTPWWKSRFLKEDKKNRWIFLETPFSHRMCILGPSRTLLKMGSIDLGLQGHFGLKLTNFRKIWACPRDNSTRIRPRISIFAHNVSLGTFQNPIENEVDRPWPSRSFPSNV